MLGEQIGESKGKRILRRVLSSDPLTAEVSVEDSGKTLSVANTGFGTYTSVVRPDGSIYGEGQGLMMTQDGEGITWKGSGVGKFGPGGAVSYRGMLYYRLAEDRAPEQHVRGFRIRSGCGRQHEHQGLGMEVGTRKHSLRSA